MVYVMGFRQSLTAWIIPAFLLATQEVYAATQTRHEASTKASNRATITSSPYPPPSHELVRREYNSGLCGYVHGDYCTLKLDIWPGED
jgi:hypothetical protein